MKKKPIRLIPTESSDQADDEAMGSPPMRPVSRQSADNLDEATGSLSRDPSEPPGNYGTRKPTFEGDDEQAVPEELAEQGVEAAEDEQARVARSRFPAA
jgi:hypothetical protein